MKAADWLDMTKADARRRGLEPVVPLLEGLATSVQALREAATRMDADDTAAADAGGKARAADAADGADRHRGRHGDHAEHAPHTTHARHEGDTWHPDHVERPRLTNAPEPPPPHGSLADVSLRLARGELTSERLVEDCLQQIRDRQPVLNAFITITADQALAVEVRDGLVILGFPEDHHCEYILSFGYPEDPTDLTRPPKPGGRHDLASLIHEERW